MNDEPKVWISSRALKSGKRSYYLRWINLTTGKWRNQKVGTDRKCAQREAALLEDKLRRGTHREVRRILWPDFVDEVTALLNGSHRRESRQILGEFAAVVSVMSPRMVRHADIKEYVEYLRSSGESRPGLKKRRNSAGTINKKLRYLNTAFNAGMRLEYVGKNPLDGWNWEKFRTRPLRILSIEEESKLLASADELYGFRMRVFLAFALETWGRLSEVTGLLWDDVDLEDRTVIFRDTKSHEDRVVPIAESSDLIAVLRRLRVQTLQEDGPFVAYANAANTSWKRKKIVAHAEIPPITIHDLRRTGVTRALLAGVPTVVVQKLAGHRDINTTLRYYTRVNVDDLRAGVERQRAALRVG